MVQGRRLGVVAIHVCLRVIGLLIDNEVRCSEGPPFCRGKKRFEVESSISMQRFVGFLPTKESREKGLRGTYVELHNG